MIIYRVENANREGPFRAYPFDIPCNHVNYKHSMYPTPREDGLWESIHVDRRDNYIYGCPSLESIVHWCGEPEVVTYLKKNNFKLARYNCSSIFCRMGKSKSQVAFHKAQAKLRYYMNVDCMLNHL